MLCAGYRRCTSRQQTALIVDFFVSWGKQLKDEFVRFTAGASTQAPGSDGGSAGGGAGGGAGGAAGGASGLESRRMTMPDFFRHVFEIFYASLSDKVC